MEGKHSVETESGFKSNQTPASFSSGNLPERQSTTSASNRKRKAIVCPVAFLGEGLQRARDGGKPELAHPSGGHMYGADPLSTSCGGIKCGRLPMLPH